MFCEQCGSGNPDGARFCAVCGATFETQPEQPDFERYQAQQYPVYPGQPTYQPRKRNISKGTFVVMIINAVVALINIFLPMLPAAGYTHVSSYGSYSSYSTQTEFYNLFYLLGQMFKSSSTVGFGVGLLVLYILTSLVLIAGAVLSFCKFKASGGIILGATIMVENWSMATFIEGIVLTVQMVHYSRGSYSGGPFVTAVPYLMLFCSIAGIVLSAIVLAKHRPVQN